MTQFTEEQITYIKTKFDEVDTDNSGSITLDELTTLLKTLGGGEFSAKISISQFDSNKDGHLTFDEFLNFAPTVADWKLVI
ncbi:MAG: hypothetical protein J3R72DRAFT_464363 [Linnemannia gamsii]|nr:hypothetical protein BGX24_002142 [Mortierella sp. AD032]KAK3808902.1 MAG: hypothetical protein J3R72DRAFT_464363 [Linnemannia gamsii]